MKEIDWIVGMFNEGSLKSVLIYVVGIAIFLAINLILKEKNRKSQKNDLIYYRYVLCPIIKEYRLSGRKIDEFEWNSTLSSYIKEYHNVIPPYVFYALLFKDKYELIKKVLIYDYHFYYKNNAKTIDIFFERFTIVFLTFTTILSLIGFLISSFVYSMSNDLDNPEKSTYLLVTMITFVIIILVFESLFLYYLTRYDPYTTTIKYMKKAINDRINSYDNSLIHIYKDHGDINYLDMTE